MLLVNRVGEGVTVTVTLAVLAPWAVALVAAGAVGLHRASRVVSAATDLVLAPAREPIPLQRSC